ncbi:MAG: endonuclease III [Bacilli bacterium]|nr:endonuclease III [Bacilli bacterium]
MKNIELIESYLDELFPNPKCELNYSNEYELLINIMLSAQTTDKRVNIVTKELYEKYNSLMSLSKADLEDLKRIIHSLGNYNKKALFIKEIATTLVTKYNGIVPKNRQDLESLPGIGRKTVNVFLSELNIEPQIAVDTHVYRVSKRLQLATRKDDVLNTEMKLRKAFKKENWNKRHLQMVLFGRYKCKAIKPECENCKLREICKGVK